ncbi:MAG TPA: M50 family metallopeptidase [Rhizomicrobium sp.]|jgi:Zn-dependent protease
MNTLARAFAYCILALPSAFVWTASQEIAGSTGALAGILFVLLYVATLAISILVHELGHACVGLANGWRLKYIAVFPLAYYPRTGKIRIWRSPSGDIGGAVSVASTPNNSPWRVAMFATGGPVASLAFAGVLLFVTSISPDKMLQNALGAFAVVSFLLGVGNLIPWRSRKGFRSDGMTLLQIAMRAAFQKPV